MLEVDKLSVRAGNETLLGPIDFSLAQGQSLVIMGESGAGKSLIAQAIMGNLPNALHSEGKIALNNQRVDVLASPQREALWGQKIALLPQEPWLALDPLMPAIHQVSETYRFVAGHTRAKANERANTDFQTLTLDGAQQRRPDQLSGGMCQRVAFAASVAGGANLLLADEPTKGLDRERAERIVALLKQINSADGGLIVITHDIAVARAIGGHTLVLKNGQCIEQNRTESVLNNPTHEYTRALIDAEPANWRVHKTPPANRVVLSASNLSVGHNNQRLIEGFDFLLQANERVAITGPSGIGKTTLLDTLAAIKTPLDGEIVRDKSISRTGVQKIYQDPPAAFARHVSLMRGLKDVAKLHRIAWPKITELLNALQINTSMLARLPGEVSGGELQRIAIARALAVQPDVLLADEPTSRLDPVTQRTTMELLANVAAQSNTAVVLVTHDEHIASRWANRSVRLT